VPSVNSDNINIKRAQFIVPLQIEKYRFPLPVFTKTALIKIGGAGPIVMIKNMGMTEVMV